MAEDRMLNDEILLGLIKANSGGGGGGTTDYEDLDNLPKVNNVELKGNKSLSDLGIASAQSVSNITNGESINNFAGVETALSAKQDVLIAGANINMTSNVVKAGVIEVVEPDMTVYENSTESGSKTYTIETTGVYEIFYCLTLQSTVSVTLPNDANVLFENNLTVSNHPVKHIVAELHEGDTVTIAQTPKQWTAVISGVLKLDAISVVDVAHTGSVADNTITYTLPNDNKYYLVVGACVGNPTGNNAVDSTSGGTAEITRTLTGSGARFRSVIVKGYDSPSFSFYGYDGGVASIIAYEIEFEEGNWDYNLATKNYVDTALATKQNTLTFDDTPTQNSTNPVKSGGMYSALAEKEDAFTAGDYLKMTNGTLSVQKSKGDDLYDYKFITTSTADVQPSVKIQRYINGVFQSETNYINDNVRDHPVTLDNLLTFTYGIGGYYWQYTLLENSNQHNKNEVVRWYYTTPVNYEETFNVPQQDTSKNLVLQEELAELAEKLPDAPTTDGTYNLQVTVSSGTPTYSWVSAE